jgi:hypothetical protein
VTGGTGGTGATGGGGTGGGSTTGGTGGTGATGGSAGKGGTGGTGGIGGAGGSSGRGGSAGVGGVSGTGGFAGTGGFGGVGGDAGTGGFAGKGGFAGVGGFPEGGIDSDVYIPPDVFIPPDVGPGPPLPTWPTTTCPSATGSQLVGTWIGYVENHPFSSGSDALKLTITAADTGALCGTLTFGDATPLAPPTNPDIGYPPNQDLTQWMPAGLPIERFAHTLFSGVVSGKRVRFQVLGYEPWRQWCTMQKSYLVDPWGSNYSCINGWGGYDWQGDAGPKNCWVQDPITASQSPVDCGKMFDCGNWRTCVCNESGCGADTINPMNFDAQFEATDARGSIILYTQNGAQVFNLYLTKN